MPDFEGTLQQRWEPLVHPWRHEDLRTRAAAWLEKHLAWQSELTFAEKFARGVPINGATPADYLQRVIDVNGVAVLAGIRFKGKRELMPFVDLLAWDGPIDLKAATRAVGDAWSIFKPRYARVLWRGEPDVLGTTLDQSVHAARAGDVAAGETDPSLRLVPWDDPGAAAALVGGIYEEFGEDFIEEVVPATAETLAWCRDDGELCRIEVDGETAGVWATAPDSVEWMPGQVVIEECLSKRFRGRRLGVSVQRLGAARLEADDVLLGTIAAVNSASRATATRAGRVEEMRLTFLPMND